MSGFAGLNGPAGSGNAIGFAVEGLDLVLGSFVSNDGRVWTTSKGSTASVDVIGFDAITVGVSDFVIERNTSSGSEWADFSSQPLAVSVGQVQLVLDVDGSLGELLRVGGSFEFALGSFFRAQGTVYLSALTQEVNLSNEESILVDSILFAAEGLSGFVGVASNDPQDPGIGFLLSDLDLLLAWHTEVEGTRVWSSIKAGIGEAAAVGVDGLTASFSDAELSIQSDADDLTVVDYSGAPLLSPMETSILLIDFDGARGPFLSLVGTIHLNIGGFVNVSGRFGMDRLLQPVTLSDGFDVDAEIMQLYAADVDGFVGVPGEGAQSDMGLTLSGMNIWLALVTPVDAADGRTWVALNGDADGAQVSGIPNDIMEVSASDVFVRMNLAASDESVIDWSASPLLFENAGGLLLDIAGTRGEVVEAGGTLSIQIGQILFINGTVRILSSVETFGLADGTTMTGRTFVLEAEGLNAFAGLNVNHADNRVGLTLEGLDLMAMFVRSFDSEDARQWTSVKAQANQIGVEGIDGVELQGDGFGLRMNQVSGGNGDEVIDFQTHPLPLNGGTDPSLILDFDGGLGQLFELGGFVSMNLFGAFAASGRIGFSRRSESMILADGSEQPMDLLMLGASDLNAYVGIGATPDGVEGMGAALQGVDFALAIGTTPEGSAVWTSLQAHADSATLVGEGLDFLADLNNVSVVINRSTGGQPVVDYGSHPLSLDVGGQSIVFSIDGALGQLVQLNADVTLNIANFLQAQGRVGIEFSERLVTLETGEAVATDFIGILAKDLTASVGVPGLGLDLQSLNLSLAVARGQGEDARVWTGLQATTDLVTVDLGGQSGLVLEVSGVDVMLNQATQGAVVDWGVTLDGASAPVSFDFGGRVGAFAGARLSASMTAFDFLSLSGDLYFESAPVTLTMAGGGSRVFDAVMFSASNVNAFAGSLPEGDELGTGLSLTDMRFGLALLKSKDETQPGIWFALNAHVGSAQLVGMDELEITEPLTGVQVRVP